MSEVRQLLTAGTRQLRDSGVDAARFDAEALLAHVLGRSRSHLLLVDNIGKQQVRRFELLLARRAAREPLQHLTGSAPFRHLELAVGPGVFVPRPETELLIDAALPLAPGAAAVDLCAGSGALALALATEAPGTSVTAVEHSLDALRWLRRNVAGRAQVVAGDVTDPGLLPELTAQVDVVLSNPPYVPTGTAVAAEVRHDPAPAVFAGPDGLAVIPAVIHTAARLLRPGGVLVLEHDDTHQAAVPALLDSTGRFDRIEDHRDLAGRPRFATARRGSDQ